MSKSNESCYSNINVILFKMACLSNMVVVYILCYSLQWQSHEAKTGEDEKREIHPVHLGRGWRKREVSSYLLKNNKTIGQYKD